MISVEPKERGVGVRVDSPSERERFQVVIAGGGPIGMGLGIELGIRGIDCLICELRPESQTFPARSNLVNARSMEHFRRWGIADRHRENDPIPERFQRDVTFVTRLNGKVLINLEGACEWKERFPISSEVPEWAPNQAIEKTLRERVEALPTTSMIWSTRVTGFVQDEDGVDVTYEGPDGQRTVRGEYFVIADGARSDLRKQLNVRLVGETLAYNTAWHFRAPGLEELFQTPLSSFTFFLNDDGFGDLIMPQSGEGHWMYMCSPLPERVDPNDWETIKQQLFRSVGAEFEVDEVVGGAWVSHSRMAPSYDFGRVFLGGDAAHLTSPFGGFGMNMGIGDSVDLGWKLAAILQGWGGPELLCSYTIERQEAERFIIDGSAHNQKVLGVKLTRPHMEEDSERGEAAREIVRELIVREKTKEFRSLGAQLGYRYDASPLIVPDGTEAPPLDYGEYVPSARPGNLAPHVWLKDDSSLYDHFGLGFCLLKLDAGVATGALEDAATELSVPLTVFELDSPEARDLYERRLALIRPDQHVAWRSDDLPADCRRLLDTVRGSLGRRSRATEAELEPTDDVLSQAPTGISHA
jgi:2-polyprenyl-6-methoxyphenol hydroxylase-like FAD-dependent oxidoreductase